MFEYIVEARDISFQYSDGTAALQGANMAIAPGSKIALLGSNGAGKSTLFLHFNGLLEPFSGKMFYKGREYIYKNKALRDLKQSVGILFQNPDNQLFSANVFQDISFGLMNLGMSGKTSEKRIHEIGELLDIVDLFQKPTHFLSVGQKKLVALAGVLVMKPEILVCDEPTSDLDPYNTNKLMCILEQLHKDGITILISTHDVNLAYSWAEKIFIINKGQIIGEGAPKDVFTNKDLLSISHLETPWIMDVWMYLRDQGLIDPKVRPPKDKKGLFNLLAP